MYLASTAHIPSSVIVRMSRSRFLRKTLGRPYILMNLWIWKQLPASLMSSPAVRAYGEHLQTLLQWGGTRTQSTGTFFLRNRPELELLVRLLNRQRQSHPISLAVLGCSKGAEVYSISYAIRSARPGLSVNLCALDISKAVVEFAEAGVYSLKTYDGWRPLAPDLPGEGEDVATNPLGDQPSSIFERLSSEETEALFDRDGCDVSIKPRFRDGIIWSVGDANDPDLPITLGLQDVVVANRFLCHMPRKEAEKCLRNLARLVKLGGYLFVSGVDLDVRTKVARELGWKPVTELIREIHDGDPSLRRDWPMQYWGLEPLNESRLDWKLRYASVFQIGEASDA